MTRTVLSTTLLAVVMAASLSERPAFAQQAAAAASGRTVRVVGTVRDETNAIALPGVPVEVVGTERRLHRRRRPLHASSSRPAATRSRWSMEGYQESLVIRSTVAEAARRQRGRRADDVAFAETVTVTGGGHRRGHVLGRGAARRAQECSVITDNVGSQEMKQNGDRDAAAAMKRVTGLSLVDNQYVFVRGLGERYSNTTLAGSVLPTTEPDKKVVPLDLFPDRPHRQRPGQQIVFAGPFRGVRRRPCPDRPAEVPEPTGARLLLRPRALLDRHRQEHPAQPARQRDCWASTMAPGRCRRDSRQQDRAPGHLHAGRRLHAGPDHRRSAGCSTTSGGRPTRTARPARTGARRSATASATRRRRQRHALLQGAVRRGGAALLPHRRTPASSRPSATTTCRPAPRGRSSASSATWPTSSRRTSAYVRELLQPQRPGRRPVLRGRQHRERASTTRTTACSSSRKD